jgi:hypothetical protein
MQQAWIQWGAAAATAVLTLMAGTPLRAADSNGVRPVAEELDKRTKPTDAPGAGPKDKLSDSAVRVMTTFAWSILPEEYKGPDGKTIKLDKSDPNKFLIPVDDARRIIRVATRSAYAEVCQLPELERANYQTLMKGEEARKVWTQDQLVFINTLHMFSVSYFTGNLKITEKEAPAADPKEPPGAPKTAGQPAPATPPASGGTPSAGDATAPAQGANSAAAPNAAGTADEAFAPKTPQCSPEQKEKVTQAINAYVQSAKAPEAKAPDAKAPEAPASKPAPVAGGSN